MAIWTQCVVSAISRAFPAANEVQLLCSSVGVRNFGARIETYSL